MAPFPYAGAGGDALDAEGEPVGDLTGNPREMGRELRSILEDLADGAAA